MKGFHVFLITVSMAGTAVSLDITLEEPPGEMAVVVGSSLALNCSLICKDCQVQMSWHFCSNGPESCVKVLNGILQSSGERHSLNYFNESVTQEHEGRYFCKVTVQVPIYRHINSRGTKVNVTEPPAPGLPGWFRSKAFMVSAAFGLLVLLLVVLFVIICVVQRRRRKPKVTNFAVYGNTRPQPSATRKQENSSKPRTQEATRGHQKSASCRTVPQPPKHLSKDSRRKSTLKT